MTDPQNPDPRRADPNAPPPPFNDPAADPRLNDYQPVPASSGRSGLIAAGVIAVLLVIALIAFSSGPATDPGTTAVIPDQTEETAPAPDAAPELAPATPDATAPAGEAPAAPTDEAPATDQ